jgi:hypothetical protein
MLSSSMLCVLCALGGEQEEELTAERAEHAEN